MVKIWDDLHHSILRYLVLNFCDVTNYDVISCFLAKILVYVKFWSSKSKYLHWFDFFLKAWHDTSLFLKNQVSVTFSTLYLSLLFAIFNFKCWFLKINFSKIKQNAKQDNFRTVIAIELKFSENNLYILLNAPYQNL